MAVARPSLLCRACGTSQLSVVTLACLGCWQDEWACRCPDAPERPRLDLGVMGRGRRGRWLARWVR